MVTYMETNTAPTTTFRVQVACFDATGTRRFHGGTVRVQAATKEEAAEVAVAQAVQRDAEQTARFNAEAEKFGTSPRKPFPVWKAEKVRRFAADN